MYQEAKTNSLIVALHLSGLARPKSNDIQNSVVTVSAKASDVEVRSPDNSEKKAAKSKTHVYYLPINGHSELLLELNYLAFKVYIYEEYNSVRGLLVGALTRRTSTLRHLQFRNSEKHRELLTPNHHKLVFIQVGRASHIVRLLTCYRF